MVTPLWPCPSSGARRLVPCRVCRRWPTDPLGVSGRGIVRAYSIRACIGYNPSVSVSVVVAPPVLFAPEGVSPGGRRAQVTDLEQKGKTALFRCGPASPSHCLALRWFRSHVGRSGVGPQLGMAMVVVVVLAVTRYPHSTGEVVGKSQWLASERGGLCVPLLAAYGGGLVALVVTKFLTLFLSESRCPILHGGFILAVSSSMGSIGLALWAVFSGFRSAGSVGVSCVDTPPLGGSACGPSTLWRSEVQGGSACGPSTLWRSEVALFLPDLVEVRDVGARVVRLWSHVVALVFYELLCLGGCSSFASALMEFLLLWLIHGWRRDLRGPWRGVREVGSLHLIFSKGN
ncbi:hypothetical protein Taro_052236 [Colocasia esculenta]|uniref:Uncharacterized protein n=1 Tax=Colocasia esculenta TaxID=4460 RepID=A0A843XIS0_COLES|nr:hypothetical protein [Colocasia esculenta]